MQLSIITVTYKAWPALENYLQSFRRYPPKATHEIIIVDNGEDAEDMRRFQAKYPEVTFIANSGNHGFSHGNNLGASHASGEYYLFLNPDTEQTAGDAIDAMMNYAQTHAEAGIVSCRQFDSAGNWPDVTRFSSPLIKIGCARMVYKWRHRQRIRQQYLPQAAVWQPDWVNGGIVLISQQLFNRIGGWDQDRFWLYYEDPDLCNRVRQAGKQIALLRDVAMLHEGGEGGAHLDGMLMVKTEDTISLHNYFQTMTANPWQRFFLHSGYILGPILFLPVAALGLAMVFNFGKAHLKILLFARMMKYYFCAIKRRTWRNPRLDFLRE